MDALLHAIEQDTEVVADDLMGHRVQGRVTRLEHVPFSETHLVVEIGGHAFVLALPPLPPTVVFSEPPEELPVNPPPIAAAAAVHDEPLPQGSDDEPPAFSPRVRATSPAPRSNPVSVQNTPLRKGGKRTRKSHKGRRHHAVRKSTRRV